MIGLRNEVVVTQRMWCCSTRDSKGDGVKWEKSMHLNKRQILKIQTLHLSSKYVGPTCKDGVGVQK